MPSLYRHRGGFTLIELLIAVVIIGILIAVAYPSYLSYVSQSRRSDARAALMAAAQRLERCYVSTMAYDENSGGACDVATDDIENSTSPGGYYKLSITNLTTTTYTLKATPQKVQADDKCGTLTLDQAGNKGIENADSGVTVSECW